jgi:2-polyprenyl-6-methoxyphenol hydroxylase-like FAD-dependent oxidoreductase
VAHVGIIGTGIGGLHLALYLQQQGVSATLYAGRSPDELRQSRLPNTAVHWSATRARERQLGVDHWDEQAADWSVKHLHSRVGLEPDPLRFRSDLDEAGLSIDQRIYTARLLEDLIDRGGDVVHGPVRMESLERLSEAHDLVVVSAGRGSMTDLFPRRDGAAAFTQPQRFLCTGIYDGIEIPSPVGTHFSFVPGGELFHVPFITFDGNRSVLFFEIVPGGELDALMTVRYEEDPRRFDRTVLELLEKAFPDTRDLVDDASFGVTRPEDVLQGAITPTARRGYAQLPNGKWVMALGDVHVVNDPLLAQGANAASACAFLLGEAIVADDLAFDELWCRRTEARLWAYAQNAFEWTNFMLRDPLPENAVRLMLAAAGDQRVADEFGDNFADPARNWNILASSARTDAYLSRRGVDVAALPGPDGPADLDQVPA